jgi:hypothetical protein
MGAYFMGISGDKQRIAEYLEISEMLISEISRYHRVVKLI